MGSANMIEQNGLSVLKKEEYSPSPSRFQNFDDALYELTRKLYDGEHSIAEAEKGLRRLHWELC